ncbi:protein LONGIFOLIA 1-like isoform X2 [Phoenix dactylifera]|uniref:Protein LONGIFOLIA 1-like isoform X2 n=1 Tax=Phoenix dactylifera TaxID=42345 RepID=A0A8B7MWV8_PHODC|nr:protein LONGIFOLIA 1-like isoform X2 [Phoenix dactylifera]
MPAKLLNTFTDDKPDLHKQNGCMSSIFLMFNRRHLLTRRHLNGSSHGWHPSGHAPLNCRSHGTEQNGYSLQIILEKNLSKSPNENRRVSMDSSRASCSSSSCSSFSSFECNKSTQQDSSSFDQTFFAEKSPKNSPKTRSSDIDTRSICPEPCGDLPIASTRSNQQSLDFRNIVKDSIYKDAQSLSVKTSTREEVKIHAYKHRDSPRPMLLSKSMDGTCKIGIDGKQKMPMDLNESLRVLKQPKEAPCYFAEASELPKCSYEAKHASLDPVSSETPRFSCDGREFSRRSLDSREHRMSTAAIKLTELPRLSLDSRESSLMSSNLDWKLNSLLNDLERSRAHQRVSTTSNLQWELGSPNHPSGVIVKLMGLEALPSLDSAAEEPITRKGNGLRGNNSSRKPLRAIPESKDDQRSHSPKTSLKDSVRPKVKGGDSVVQQNYRSRTVTQAAYRRQQDSDHVPGKTTLGYREAHVKQETEFVYSEVEKRSKELKFQQPNKDLRALKQILDAMHAKGLLETQKGEDFHYKITVREDCSNHIPIGDFQNSRSQNVRKPSIEGSSSPRALESPIVTMRPARSVKSSAPSLIPLESLSGLQKLRTSDPVDRKKGSANSKMVKDQPSKGSHKKSSNQFLLSTENGVHRTRLYHMHGLPSPQQSLGENSGSSERISSSLSPRLQQRKSKAEKTCPPPIPPDVNKPRRQSPNRRPSELVSPRGKLGLKSSHALQSDDQLNEKASELRNSVHLEDEISQWSDNNTSLESQTDVVEVMSADQSTATNSAFFQQGFKSPSRRRANCAALVLNQKKPSFILNEDISPKELATEQPSPVSVLDASFYQDGLPPSSVKKRNPNVFEDEKNPTSDDGRKTIGLPDAPPPKMISEIDYKKLQQLTSTNDEPSTIDLIASPSDTKNVDHQYVSEILLASNLLVTDGRSCGLRCSMPIQLHPTGHPINPRTNFTWLSKAEPVQEKTLQPKPDSEKLHRKLVFDVVNEILLQKMELVNPRHRHNHLLGARKLCSQNLLKELCSEVDQLQAERLKASSFDDDSDGNLISCKDLLRQSEGWTDFGSELAGLVLEIERSIFKDLIDEVVTGEAANAAVC